MTCRGFHVHTYRFTTTFLGLHTQISQRAVFATKEKTSSSFSSQPTILFILKMAECYFGYNTRKFIFCLCRIPKTTRSLRVTTHVPVPLGGPTPSTLLYISCLSTPHRNIHALERYAPKCNMHWLTFLLQPCISRLSADASERIPKRVAGASSSLPNRDMLIYVSCGEKVPCNNAFFCLP